MANAREIFGHLVVEKSKTRLPDLKEFPRYVVECLINRFCPGENFDEELGQVRKKLAQNYAAPADKDRILYEARERGKYDLIARVEVTLDLKTDTYVGAIPSLNLRGLFVPETLLNRYPRLIGGLWGIGTLQYQRPNPDNPVPLIALVEFQPFQYGKVDIKEFESKRCQFTRDEWIDLLMNTVGFNPEFYTFRQKMFVLVRLASIAERMVHLIELGPRETGKSYGYKNLSYYSYMLSGGRATPAVLFVHGGNGTPGLVARFDTLVFDEIANTEFKDPTATVSIFKDYMEYGNFTLGKYPVKGEASIVMIGNLNVLGNMPHEMYEHLLEPLPSELIDPALFERVHGFIPGWEMPKLEDRAFAKGYGFTLDFFAEVLHLLRSTLLPFDPSTRYKLYNAKSRDSEAIAKVTKGLTKLLHPDGKVTDQELAEYVGLAAEMRQRVKDQLSVIAPGEYPHYTIEYEINGVRQSANPPERGRKRAIALPPQPTVGIVAGLVVSQTVGGQIQLVEVEAYPGKGEPRVRGNVKAIMKSSLAAACDAVRALRSKLKVSTEFTDGFHITALPCQMAVPKEGPSAGLAFAVGVASAITKQPVPNDVAFTGEVTMKGFVHGIGGLAQKLDAAKKSGVRTVLIPKDNEKELQELPPQVAGSVKVICVSTLEEAFKEIGYLK
ncbi:MAG: BREX system Lon protease-like protein BrxL [Verrucomicrobiae bacterium]|nr:BREX system Lon protease-like protein BrxL [Verrucomicrobiae bacterium]